MKRRRNPHARHRWQYLGKDGHWYADVRDAEWTWRADNDNDTTEERTR